MIAFDIAAQSYDEDFTHSIFGKRQRERVWTYLKRLTKVKKTLQILELNCGTGEDAIFFAKQGHNVLATDIAPQMLSKGMQKASEQNLQNIQFQKLDLTDISLKLNKTFDFIFSNFGGLNCVSQNDLNRVQKFVHEHLNEGGDFVFVVMPKSTMMEYIYRKWNGELEVYKKRSNTDPLDVNVSGEGFQTYYYNPNDILSNTKEFEVKEILATGFMPSYFSKSRFVSLFKLIDHILCSIAMPAKYSDHFLVHLKKTS